MKMLNQAYGKTETGGGGALERMLVHLLTNGVCLGNISGTEID
jgi:hypothetical protein